MEFISYFKRVLMSLPLIVLLLTIPLGLHSVEVKDPLSSEGFKSIFAEDVKEILYDVLKPDFISQDQEQNLKLQIVELKFPHDKLPLAKAIFKIKLNHYKEKGFCIEEFLKEAQARITNKTYQLTFEGEDYQIKNELFLLYHYLIYLALESDMVKYSGDRAYPYPFLQIFDLEKETQFPLFGKRLLQKDLSHCGVFFLCFDLCSNDSDFWEQINSSIEIEAQRFWDSSQLFIKTLFLYLEKYPEVHGIKDQLIAVTLGGYFNSKLHQVFSHIDHEYDPLEFLFPHIIKYISMDKIEKYFYQRFEGLPVWEKEGLWVNLHFKAYEILFPSELEKAQECLLEVERVIDAKLWAYPFSFNYFAWEEERRSALLRLDEFKAKLDPTL